MIGVAPVGIVPLASWWVAGNLNSLSIPMAIDVETNPCDSYAATISATTWSDQTNPATTWTEGSSCGS